jgi:TatD DNase family protein
MLFDSHAHLDSFEKAGELDAVLERAAAEGVAAVAAVGGSPEANDLAVATAERYPGRVVAVCGYDRDLAGRSPDLGALGDQLNAPSARAVGECGLDYHYEPETAGEQVRLFEAMAAISLERRLPLVVHSREAAEDTLGVLRAHAAAWEGPGGEAGVLHCFTGSRTFAFQLLDLGYRIGFSGIVTFRGAEALREVAAAVPEDRMLVETDAPYLAPVPHRGAVNEPAFVRLVAEAIAREKRLPAEALARAVTEGARRLFGMQQMNGGE